jgi:hypothetical protein
MTDYPITPPPELVQQLCDKAILHAVDGAKRGEIEVWLIQEAFRAGADQELEACCEWMAEETPFSYINALSEARRPKPPSLKEQALECLKNINDACESEGFSPRSDDTDIIRRALESLPD